MSINTNGSQTKQEIFVEETANNVIKFPKENSRLDLSNIAVDFEEIANNIHLMKKSYLSDVADAILDDVLRSISCLNLEETKNETYQMEGQDLILIKESIVASMCRIIGISHPLHSIGKENLIQEFDSNEDEYSLLSYKFKSEVTSDNLQVPAEDLP